MTTPRRWSDEELAAELLRLARMLGRPPTYLEFGLRLNLSTSSVHDAMVRLRAAGVVRSEPRIALTPDAAAELARVVLGIRIPADAASRLLSYTQRRGAA